jgi:hypothetical protein
MKSLQKQTERAEDNHTQGIRRKMQEEAKPLTGGRIFYFVTE